MSACSRSTARASRTPDSSIWKTSKACACSDFGPAACPIRPWRRLKNVAQLEALDLAGANVRGTGLRYLKSLESLRALVLGPGIEDAGLRLVGDLSQLEELDLRSCRQITDAGLAHLDGLKSLQRIACPPQITDEAKQSLGQKLPKCEFFR